MPPDHPVDNPLKELKANISQGLYKSALNDSKNCVGKHWTTIYCIVDQNGSKIKDAYICVRPNCKELILTNLKTEGTGKLRRHYEKCNNSKRIGIEPIDAYFEKEFNSSAAKRIKKIIKRT